MDKDLADREELEKNKFMFGEIELHEGLLHDQVTAAIEGGSNYWANINVGKHELGWRNYFTAKFTLLDEPVTHQLSVEKLKAGLVILAKKAPRLFAQVLDETGDADTGDALVQCALLGDIVYG